MQTAGVESWLIEGSRGLACPCTQLRSCATLQNPCGALAAVPRLKQASPSAVALHSAALHPLWCAHIALRPAAPHQGYCDLIAPDADGTAWTFGKRNGVHHPCGSEPGRGEGARVRRPPAVGLASEAPLAAALPSCGLGGTHHPLIWHCPLAPAGPAVVDVIRAYIDQVQEQFPECFKDPQPARPTDPPLPEPQTMQGEGTWASPFIVPSVPFVTDPEQLAVSMGWHGEGGAGCACDGGAGE